MVLAGRVLDLDRIGKTSADEASDFGRQRVVLAVVDARRNLSGVCGRWRLVIIGLRRFFFAISRAVVNLVDGEGTANDPLIWSAGALLKRRRLVHVVLDRSMLLGLAAIWASGWVNVPASAINAEDVAH